MGNMTRNNEMVYSQPTSSWIEDERKAAGVDSGSKRVAKKIGGALGSVASAILLGGLAWKNAEARGQIIVPDDMSKSVGSQVENSPRYQQVQILPEFGIDRVVTGPTTGVEGIRVVVDDLDMDETGRAILAEYSASRGISDPWSTVAVIGVETGMDFGVNGHINFEHVQQVGSFIYAQTEGGQMVQIMHANPSGELMLAKDAADLRAGFGVIPLQGVIDTSNPNTTNFFDGAGNLRMRLTDGDGGQQISIVNHGSNNNTEYACDVARGGGAMFSPVAHEIGVAVTPVVGGSDMPSDAPEFLVIQQQVAGSTENYTIMGNGNVEGKLPDGTIGIVPGVHLNPDGKGYTIMVNGAPIVIDADKVSITDAGITADGYTFDAATGNFSEGFNLESWAPTTEHGAEFVSNLDLWNVPQEIRDSIKCEANLCYDADGKVIFDASTGQYGLDFIQEALSTWGGVGGPQEKPNPRSSRPRQPFKNGAIPNYSVKLASDFREYFKLVTGTDSRITGDSTKGKMERILVGEDRWMNAMGEEIADHKVIFNYLAYRPKADESKVEWYSLIPTPASDIDKIWGY